MGKTLLNLDREMLKRAQAILGTPTLTATVNMALRRVIAEDAGLESQSIPDWAQKLLDNLDPAACILGKSSHPRTDWRCHRPDHSGRQCAEEPERKAV